MDWHCTRLGRVVYDRKPHPFSWKDALRIVRKIPQPGLWEFEERFIVAQILAELLQKNILGSFFRIFQSFDPEVKDRVVLGDLLEGILSFTQQLTEQTRVVD